MATQELEPYKREIDEGNQSLNLKLYEYEFLKTHSEKYFELKRNLLEFMGYEDEFLITHAGLKKLKKDDLASIVLEQRNMIRKLIDELEPSKRESHMQYLDNLYTNKGTE